MNADRLQGSLKQLKGRLKEQWGKLIGDQFLVFDGKRDQKDGETQAAYGNNKEQARNDYPAGKYGRNENG